MPLENKLGLTNAVELALEEERISKTRATEMFENRSLESLQPGSFDAVSSQGQTVSQRGRNRGVDRRAKMVEKNTKNGAGGGFFLDKSSSPW